MTSSVQIEVEDISNLDGLVQRTCPAVEQCVPVPIIMSCVAPTVVPTGVAVLATMMSGTYTSTQEGWKHVDMLGSDGSDKDDVCSMVCYEVGSHAVGGDGMVSSDDDDYRHRRRGCGDEYVGCRGCLDRSRDRMHPFVIADRDDECLGGSGDSVLLVVNEDVRSCCDRIYCTWVV